MKTDIALFVLGFAAFIACIESLYDSPAHNPSHIDDSVIDRSNRGAYIHRTFALSDHEEMKEIKVPNKLVSSNSTWDNTCIAYVNYEMNTSVLSCDY